MEALLAILVFGAAFILSALLGKQWSRYALGVAVCLAVMLGAGAFLSPTRSMAGIASTIAALGAGLFMLGVTGHALFEDRTRAVLSTLAIGAIGTWPLLLFAVAASCIHTERCI